MPLIAPGHIAAAVRTVWPLGSVVPVAKVSLNRRATQDALPAAVIRVRQLAPIRESDGIAVQRFDVDVMLWLTDSTITESTQQTLDALPATLRAAGLAPWPAGLVLAPDVVPRGDGTLETDPRLLSAGDVFALRTRFEVVIQPIP